MEMTWNNKALQECLCWDDSKSGWCADIGTQCKPYLSSLRGALVGYYFAYAVASCALLYLCFRGLSYCSARVPCLPMVKGTLPLARKPYLVGVAMAAVVYIAGAAPFLTFAGDLHTGLQFIRDDNSHFSKSMVSDITTAASAAHDLGSTLGVYAQVGGYTVPVVDKVNTWEQHIMNGSNGLLPLPAALVIMWLFPVGLLVICCLLKVRNVHNVGLDLLTIFTICVVLLICVGQCAISVSGKVAHDLCNDQLPATAQAAKIMGSEWQCVSGDGPLDGMKHVTEYLKGEYAYQQSSGNASTATSLRNLCGAGKLFECGHFDEQSTLAHLGSIIRKTSKLHGSNAGCIGCSIGECVTMCGALTDAQISSATMVLLQHQVDESVAMLETHAAPWVHCTSFDEWITALSGAMCRPDSVSETMPTMGSVGILTLIVSLLVVVVIAAAPYIQAAAVFPEASGKLLGEPAYIYWQPVSSFGGAVINCATEETNLPDADVVVCKPSA
ncbi:hypothetical protein DIPPA_21963 [Diplonema papillatum]|nr:hypothetical protein DIPPA_21963 [Diplonema papillatum]